MGFIEGIMEHYCISMLHISTGKDNELFDNVFLLLTQSQMSDVQSPPG